MLAPFPTTTQPGSLARQIIYRWCDSHDFHIFHPDDRRDEIPTDRRMRPDVFRVTIPVPSADEIEVFDE